MYSETVIATATPSTMRERPVMEAVVYSLSIPKARSSVMMVTSRIIMISMVDTYSKKCAICRKWSMLSLPNLKNRMNASDGKMERSPERNGSVAHSSTKYVSAEKPTTMIQNVM